MPVEEASVREEAVVYRYDTTYIVPHWNHYFVSAAFPGGKWSNHRETIYFFFSAHSSHLICNYWLIFCLFLISYLLYNLRARTYSVLAKGCLRFLGTAVVQLTLRRKWKCNWMFDTTVCSRWGGTNIFRKMHHQTLQWASAGWRCWGNHFHRVLLLEMQFWYI